MCEVAELLFICKILKNLRLEFLTYCPCHYSSGQLLKSSKVVLIWQKTKYHLAVICRQVFLNRDYFTLKYCPFSLRFLQFCSYCHRSRTIHPDHIIMPISSWLFQPSWPIPVLHPWLALNQWYTAAITTPPLLQSCIVAGVAPRPRSSQLIPPAGRLHTPLMLLVCAHWQEVQGASGISAATSSIQMVWGGEVQVQLWEWTQFRDETDSWIWLNQGIFLKKKNNNNDLSPLLCVLIEKKVNKKMGYLYSLLQNC